MKRSLAVFTTILVAIIGFLSPAKTFASSSPTYLITNNDAAKANSATYYAAGKRGTSPILTDKAIVATKGSGVEGGDFATTQIAVLKGSSQSCVFVADGESKDIAALVASKKTLVGNYQGSSNDIGAPYGIALVVNNSYLYAGFSGSDTIATFQVLSGCALSFVSDIYVGGLNGGWINGMALNGNMLVVAYGDGSIQSFNVSTGTPSPNGDLQNSTGYGSGNLPVAVDITQDGHYAIFGDASSSSVVEVSDISSGLITPTVVYTLGSGVDSSNVRLSPDETLLYITNNFSGQVTAAFFDASTGVLSAGCTSAVLRGVKYHWYLAGLATLTTTGTGTDLYVAEGGGPYSFVGILEVQSSNGQCTLTESSYSPVPDKHSIGLMSIGTFPPRPF